MSNTGDKVVAMATVSDTQNTSGTTISTGYTATLTGGTAAGQVIVAPPSGAVLVHNTAAIGPSAAVYDFMDFEVRNGGVIGAGTVFRAPSDTTASRHADPNFVRATTSTLVTGLTPGNTYNIRQQYRVNSGTGIFQDKHLVLMPQP